MPYGGAGASTSSRMELSAVGQPHSHAAMAFSVPESCLSFAYGRARELARLASCFMEPVSRFAHKLDGHPRASRDPARTPLLTTHSVRVLFRALPISRALAA